MKRLGQKIEVLQTVGAVLNASSLPIQAPLKTFPQQEPPADYTWKIANFTRKLAQANSNNDAGDIESEPFFTSHGYKMKVSSNLNEGPSGDTGYMGIYIHLMKSNQDGSLVWPFAKNITFVLVDQQDDVSQRQNISYTLIPEAGETSFNRPRRQRENTGFGKPRFVKHSTLRTREYIKDYAVYIRVIIIM